MAFDEELAARVREAVAARGAPCVEQRMFGGLAMMVGGHMAVGVLGEELVVRLGPVLGPAAASEEHVRTMDFTGRPMKTMVIVSPEGLEGGALDSWVGRGLAFVAGLPPKEKA